MNIPWTGQDPFLTLYLSWLTKWQWIASDNKANINVQCYCCLYYDNPLYVSLRGPIR